MLKEMKRVITGVAVTLVFTMAAYVVYAAGNDQTGDSENKKTLNNEPTKIPMLNLDFDTHYFPLPDINSDQVIEKEIDKNQVENNGILFQKTKGYETVAAKNDLSMILIDEKGHYIAVGQGDNQDICIVRYDTSGKEIKRQTYGGSDFDAVYAAKYNPKMGIVVAGVSQSKNGDFADVNDSFVACIDAETLAFRWVYPVQIADEVYEVTDDAVFVVHNEGEPYNGKGDLKLSVVKLNRDGKKVWQTRPFSQWIHSIGSLKDGKIIVVQKFVGDKGEITCFSKAGEELTKIKADCYGAVTTTDDGGFSIVSIRNIKTIPQPAYISSVWYDTETVVTKYDKDYKVQWRKTYDSIKDAVGVDKVIPLNDAVVIDKVIPLNDVRVIVPSNVFLTKRKPPAIPEE